MRLLLLPVLVLFLAATGYAAALAFPQPFFPYAVTQGALTLRSATPLPKEAAEFLQRIAPEMQLGPFPADFPITFYLTEAPDGKGWRQAFYLAAVPQAGGVTYGFAPGTVYLSGADIAANRLLKNGRIVPPPKTLGYYFRHEAAHLALNRKLGVLRYFRLRAWVREGLADVQALGVPDFAALAARYPPGPTGMNERVADGAYPRERLVVAWLLGPGGWTMPQLLETGLSLDAADALVRAGLAGG